MNGIARQTSFKSNVKAKADQANNGHVSERRSSIVADSRNPNISVDSSSVLRQ